MGTILLKPELVQLDLVKSMTIPRVCCPILPRHPRSYSLVRAPTYIFLRAWQEYAGNDLFPTVPLRAAHWWTVCRLST